MGGACVFPGGRLDPEDHDLHALALGDGGELVARRFPDLSPEAARAHAVGALREMFEEAGILIATRNGVAVDGLDAGQRERLTSGRARLNDGATTFHHLVEAEGMRLPLDALVPFANFVTPPSEKKRYDVRFFAARAPEGQEPVADTSEITEALWIDPADATDRCRRRELLLAPPTWTILRWLSRWRTVEEALSWARVTGIAPIQPRLSEQPDGKLLALPGDVLYPAIPGVEPLRETRFRFADGRWTAIESPDAGL